MENLFGGNKRWRPKKNKIVNKISRINSFGPLWVDTEYLWIISLTKEEFEAIRLKNIENYDIIEAWNKMWIWKSTFANIYNSAIQKISQALVYGKILEL